LIPCHISEITLIVYIFFCPISFEVHTAHHKKPYIMCRLRILNNY
jgi:hypothetical protein